MADKSFTIVTPTATTNGVSITITNTATGRVAYVGYDPGAGFPPQFTAYSEAEVANAPVAIRNAITTLFTQMVPNAAGRMGF